MGYRENHYWNNIVKPRLIVGAVIVIVAVILYLLKSLNSIMKALELYAFNCLEKYEQLEYLWSKGTFMASKREGDYIIGLYDLHYFYVEVLYDSVNNAINELRSFKSLDLIEPYFERYLTEIKNWLK